MAWSFKRKSIRCPNCSYLGLSKAKERVFGPWMLGFAILLLAPFTWPVFILIVILFIWQISMPIKHFCPKCQFPNPIPLSREEVEQQLSSNGNANPTNGAGEIC